jgi:small subunit ribosomal protein S17
VSEDAVTEQSTQTDQGPQAEAPGHDRGYRKTRRGYVVSDKMDKTVVVAVEDRVKHPLYGKVMRRTSKVKAHDEQNQCGIGDSVRIMETRPLSAAKRWRVVEILEKAK